MSKVSKNIKRLRAEQKITQDALAEKINISRQAISNWENDKTQPDIQSLEKLAEAFDVEIEELIYGKKRQVGIEPDGDRAKAKIRIILAIIGSLFLGIGLILIFVNFWRVFPFTLKGVFSVVPIIISQAFAIYVMKKRSESILWRESAATLWCVGCIATIALINSVFGIHCGYEMCLLIDIILCLPTFWMFGAVSPVIAYYYMVIHWSVLSEKAFVSFIFLAVALVFVYLYHKKCEDFKFKYLLWITAFAIPIYFIFMSARYLIPFVLIFALLIMYYAMSSDSKDLSTPWKPIGVFGTMVALLRYSQESLAFLLSEYEDVFSSLSLTNVAYYKASEVAVTIIIALVLVGMGVFIGRKSFEDNLYKILLTAVAFIGLTACAVVDITHIKFFAALTILAAYAYGILLIIKGVRELRLLSVNLGLLMIFLQILMLLQIIGDNILLIGIAFVIFGALLIAVNIRLSAYKKTVNETECEEE